MARSTRKKTYIANTEASRNWRKLPVSTCPIGKGALLTSKLTNHLTCACAGIVVRVATAANRTCAKIFGIFNNPFIFFSVNTNTTINNLKAYSSKHRIRPQQKSGRRVGDEGIGKYQAHQTRGHHRITILKSDDNEYCVDSKNTTSVLDISALPSPVEAVLRLPNPSLPEREKGEQRMPTSLWILRRKGWDNDYTTQLESHTLPNTSTEPTASHARTNKCE